MKYIKDTGATQGPIILLMYLCFSFGREMEEKVTLLNAPTKRPR